jgi:hypothetical protein
MTRQLTVQVTLTFDVYDEMALAEAGFRRHRELFGNAIDTSAEMPPEAKALTEALAGTPEAALTTILGVSGGPLEQIEVPGARVVGVGVSGPEVPGGTLTP